MSAGSEISVGSEATAPLVSEIGADPWAASSASLRERTVRGTLWATADQVVTQGIQLLLYIVMAHLLAPKAFGVMAMAVVFIGFATLLGQLGLDAALVQSQRLDQATVTGVFWLAVLGNLVIGAALAAASPAIAAFYHSDELVRLLLLIAPVPLLGALATVPRSMLIRRLDFLPLFVVDLTAAVASLAITVAVALTVGGAISLGVGLLSRGVLQTVGLWGWCRWKPSLRPNLRRARPLLSYSGHLLGFNVINYWARNADNLLIGRVLGAVALGFYERAYLLMLYPVTQVMATLGRVMISTLSRMGSDVERVGRTYVRSVGALALVTAPLMLGLAVLAEPFVVTVFGEHWRPMVPTLRVLAVVGAGQAITSSVGFVYQSQARTRLMLVMGSANAAVFVIAIVIGVRMHSILAVAVAYAIATAVVTYPTLAIPARVLDLQFRDVAAACAPSFAAAVVMAGIVELVEHFAIAGLDPVWRLTIGVVLGALLYAGAIISTGSAALSDLRSLLSTYTARRATATSSG